jgi:hypothetical protein
VDKIKVRLASISVSSYGIKPEAQLSAIIVCYSKEDAERLANILGERVEPEEPINPPEGE